MGMNYYLHTPAKKCRECGHDIEEKPTLHIGKASSGWHFQFNTTVYKSVSEWAKVLRISAVHGSFITDERDGYGDEHIMLADFFHIIHLHRTGPNCALVSSQGVANIACEDGMDCCPFEFS